ncbi:MAG: Transcriptional regulator of heat shock protein [candidate division WS6 bacterium GW2011_WS6_36_26]|nr:MAG: Transcriptional regulator of heat shock protein [candidate division WS6 bacterium GW2011_WS6_36_26]
MGDAEEVGSLSLVEKYHLGVSSATIRNEMVKLMQLGLLEQTHSSSGRLPTDQALRLYVSEMLGRNVINPLMSIEIRQGIFRDRFSKDIVIKSVLHILSKETDSVVFLILDEDIRYYGLANLLSFDEFQSIEKIRSIVNILEDEVFLKNITEKYSGSGVSLLIGGESGVGTLQDCAMAFTKIPFWGRDTGYVGILGSKRMDYSKVIPALKEVKSSLESSMSGWR